MLYSLIAQKGSLPEHPFNIFLKGLHHDLLMALPSLALAHTQDIQCDFKSSQTAHGEEREVAHGKSITHMLSVERECKKGDRMEIIFRGDEEQFRFP